jgi:hypothetical protein
MDRIEGSQQTALSFQAAWTLERKEKAGDSVDDKLTATIEQLMAARKEMAESQKAFLDSNKPILNRHKELMKTIKTQSKEIKALRTLIQDGMSQRTYI